MAKKEKKALFKEQKEALKEAQQIYDRLLQLFLLFYNEDNLTNEREDTNESEKK